MFNNNSMTVVTDLNILGPEINNVDFITIAAITVNNYPQLPNIYNASILVPPTDILMAWADNAPLIMQNEYIKYLNSKDADEMIVAIIAALTKKNIILYIPKEEFNIFGSYLLNHIYYTYGITCNFMNTQFHIMPMKIPFIISKFYIMDLMDSLDYIASYPSNILLPEWVIPKLIIDLNPFNGKQATFTEYYNYFNSLNSKSGNGKPIVDMIKVVDKK